MMRTTGNKAFVGQLGSSRESATTMMRRFLFLILILIVGSFVHASADDVNREDAQQRTTTTGSFPAEESIPPPPPSSLPLWRPEIFPSLKEEDDKCRWEYVLPEGTMICDPDGILLEDGMTSQPAEHNQRLVEALRIASQTRIDSCKKDKDSIDAKVQVGVALVHKMDLSSSLRHHRHGRYDDDEIVESAAQKFAESVHDAWGVGYEIESCGGGTGVLIFLSMKDRVMYISRGGSLVSVLTRSRIDSVIDSARPLLREQSYSLALAEATLLLTEYINKGPPTWWESDEMIGVALFLGFFGLAGALRAHEWWKDRREARLYARVESQLSELDQARALALQGQYKATSCPICLEDFKSGDDQAREASSSTETVTNDANEGAAPSQQQDMVGSDGLPLKLLRCGHVFDETCWAEWVNSGRGTITKCPICQQDVGASNNTATTETTELQREAAEHSVAEDNQERRLRRFRHERNFRLARMATRYPRYIRPNQVQRWTSSTYDGQLMARDTSFVESNPRNVAARARSSHSGHRTGGTGFRSGGGFGGGRSAGGGGGRW